MNNGRWIRKPWHSMAISKAAVKPSLTPKHFKDKPCTDPAPLEAFSLLPLQKIAQITGTQILYFCFLLFLTPRVLHYPHHLHSVAGYICWFVWGFYWKQPGLRVCKLLKVYFSERSHFLVSFFNFYFKLLLPPPYMQQKFCSSKTWPCLQLLYQFLETEVDRVCCERGIWNSFTVRLETLKKYRDLEFLKLKRLHQCESIAFNMWNSNIFFQFSENPVVGVTCREVLVLFMI